MKYFVTGDTYPVKDQLKALGCRWDRDQRAWYTGDEGIYTQAQAIVGTPPVRNAPGPVDLGTTDPADLAAHFGRTALPDATIKQFSCAGLDKGDNGLPNGSIRKVRGVRYVQVARTRRRYLSRDDLDDFDDFSTPAGGQYNWDGVPVVSTEEELAADAAAAAAKQRPIDAKAAWDACVTQISTVCDSRPAWLSDTTRVGRWHAPSCPHTGAYAELHIGETEVCFYTPGYFACDWDYPAVCRVATATPELVQQITAAVALCRECRLVT